MDQKRLLVLSRFIDYIVIEGPLIKQEKTQPLRLMEKKKKKIWTVGG